MVKQPAMEARGTRGQLGGQDLKGFGFQPPGLPASSIITAVQQQDYSASVWLRRREKLEHVSSEWREILEQLNTEEEDSRPVEVGKCFISAATLTADILELSGC